MRLIKILAVCIQVRGARVHFNDKKTIVLYFICVKELFLIIFGTGHTNTKCVLFVRGFFLNSRRLGGRRSV